MDWSDDDGDDGDELTLAAAYRTEADEWWAEARLHRERAEHQAQAMEARAARLAATAAMIEHRHHGAAA